MPDGSKPAGMGRDNDRPGKLRRRRAVLDLLKQHGPQDAATLAGQLGVTAMAVRQHLYELSAQGLVAHEEVARPVGRPAKLWHLTPAADAFFPDGHADLAISLIDAMRETFGEAGVDQLVAARSREQAAAYRQRMAKTRSLKTRLEALAAVRTDEGYMAGVEAQDDGGFLLVENHCPICAAAATCSGLCRAELEVFQEVLGEDVAVERTDHILAGARRCAYRVRSRGSGSNN